MAAEQRIFRAAAFRGPLIERAGRQLPAIGELGAGKPDTAGHIASHLTVPVKLMAWFDDLKDNIFRIRRKALRLIAKV
jgi:hypothetical protein